MFDIQDITLPPLYPLMYLSLTPCQLDYGVEGQGALFRLTDHGESYELYADSSLEPGSNWSIKVDKSPEKSLSYCLINGPNKESTLELSPERLLYQGLTCRPIKKHSAQILYLLQLVVPDEPGENDQALSAIWQYTWQHTTTSSDRNEWIINEWQRFLRRRDMLRRKVEEKSPLVLINDDRKLTNDALRRIARVVPAFKKEVCSRPELIDIKELRTKLLPELPPSLRKYLDFTGEKAATIVTDKIEREILAVRLDVKGRDLVEAKLSVTTNEGPSQRPKQGFAFLFEILEVIPPQARHNTGGKEEVTELDLSKLPFDDYTKVVSINDAADALKAYRECFNELKSPLEHIIFKFAQSGKKETWLVPVEE